MFTGSRSLDRIICLARAEAIFSFFLCDFLSRHLYPAHSLGDNHLWWVVPNSGARVGSGGRNMADIQFSKHSSSVSVGDVCVCVCVCGRHGD